MPDIPLSFTWEVAEHGYHWLETRAVSDPDRSTRPFLTHGRPIGGALNVRRYQPLAAFSGLFRGFAATPPTSEAIKEFADRFGMLGGNLVTPILLHDEPEKQQSKLGTGEDADAWIREILIMRHAVELWDAARQGDVEQLGQVIHWEPDHSGVRIDTHPGPQLGQLVPAPTFEDRTWIASTHLGDDIVGRFVPGDLAKPALHRVQSLINEHLRGRASPRLLWDADRDRFSLFIVPEGLIGALWLQFARAVEGDSQFRQCVECATSFEVAPGRGRADKLYCSTPCRIRAYRKRQVEAVRLHGDGRSVDEIARELESDSATVRGWIERSVSSARPGQGETT